MCYVALCHVTLYGSFALEPSGVDVKKEPSETEDGAGSGGSAAQSSQPSGTTVMAPPATTTLISNQP